jgi:hypothetical protein
MVDLQKLRLMYELREQGIDWPTVHDTVGSTDNDRKLLYGYKLGLEEENDANLLKQAKTLQTIRTARKNLGVERSINNEQIRDISLHQTFTNQVVKAIEKKYNDMFIEYDDIEPSEKAHIFTLADFHYNGDETYLEVINRATREIIKVIREKDLKEIIVVELGDVIEGASLRNSQLMGIKKGMVQQLMDVADRYIKMLCYLDTFVNVKFISVDSSNHTQLRNLGTKQNQLIEEDLMIVFNRYIEKALPTLDFIHGEDVVTNILGFNCFFAHGHLVKSKEKYLETLQTNRNIMIDFGWFGHFHHQRSIDLHSTGYYDKKAFYVPALNVVESSYEKNLNLSSCAGIGYYVLDKTQGIVEERKLKV